MMVKQDMVSTLVKKIRYNKEQREYYYQKESSSDNPAMFSEMRAWYEGRESAFKYSLSMIAPEHPEVTS